MSLVGRRAHRAQAPHHERTGTHLTGMNSTEVNRPRGTRLGLRVLGARRSSDRVGVPCGTTSTRLLGWTGNISPANRAKYPVHAPMSISLGNGFGASGSPHDVCGNEGSGRIRFDISCDTNVISQAMYRMELMAAGGSWKAFGDSPNQPSNLVFVAATVVLAGAARLGGLTNSVAVT